MKDIKENQQGLKSLASERPDVVKKMGYDPESFYAGGLAMLAAGGEASTNMDPDDAIEEFKNRQEYAEGGILKAANGTRAESRRSKTNEEKGLEELLEEVITPDYTMEQTGDITEDDYKKMFVGEADALNPEKDKKLSKSEMAFAVLEGLGSLAEAMPKGFTTSGGIGEAVGPNMVPLTRVGMAVGGIMEMESGGLAGLRKIINDIDENELLKIIDPKRAAMMSSANMNMMSGRGTGQQEDLLSLIDASPLSEEDKDLQKQIARMQLAQQTMVGTPQYIPTDAPYKAVYRPYFSEVTKTYNAARPGKAFSPLAGPPRERVDFNLGMRSDGTLGGPRRVAGVQYAADGMLIDGQFFPETDERVEGPGGERDDKIPAMLSDGEFVVNAKTVRGMGLQAGADPMNFEEQRNIGSKVLEYLQDTMGPRGDMAAKMGEQGLGALVRSMS